jgi:hypothetical protein
VDDLKKVLGEVLYVGARYYCQIDELEGRREALGYELFITDKGETALPSPRQ